MGKVETKKLKIINWFRNNNYLIKVRNLSKKFDCNLNYTYMILRELRNENKVLKVKKGSYYIVNEQTEFYLKYKK